jgi:Zn-dependent protease with chaperone function
MAGRGALIRRALVSAALWAGFWVLGAAIVAGLLAIPVAQATYGAGPDLGGFAAGAAAVLVAWSLRPRRGLRWRRAEGAPPLSREEAPALHALVADAARRAGVPAPDEVRLSARPNASIGEERWRFGLARARVLELGLPLFVVLDRAELGAVVAHELGHARGGDVLLGAWVHRTRGAIAGAVDGLDGSAFFLDVPFRAYGALFLRASGAVSRAQELSADACAASAFGAAAAWGALRKIEVLGGEWDVYFNLDALPAVEHGARVPLVEGFRRFLAAQERRPEVARALALGAEAPPHPGDTHPPHAQRLLAVDPARRADAPSPPPAGCLDLLGGEAAAEEAWYRRALSTPLPAVGWDEVADERILPGLAEELAGTSLDPAGADLGRFPALARDPAAAWGAVARGVNLLSPEARRQRGLSLLGAWLAVALRQRGFSARARPGAELVLVRGGEEVAPWSLARAVADGRVDGATFDARRRAWDEGAPRST